MNLVTGWRAGDSTRRRFRLNRLDLSMLERKIQTIIGKFEKLAPPRIAQITSHYAVEQLPTNEHCEQCNGPLTPGVAIYQCNNVQGSRLIVRAENVPALCCYDGCGGSFIPAEVMVDLLDQALPLLRTAGDIEASGQLEGAWLDLKNRAKDHPTFLSKLQAA